MNFFKTIALISNATLDNESEMNNVLETCPWTTTKYYRYSSHMKGFDYKKDVQSCLDITFLQFVIGDLDSNMKIDRCEASLWCIGTKAYNKFDPQTLNEWDQLRSYCIKHSPAFDWQNVVKYCNKTVWDRKANDESYDLSLF